MTTSMRMDVDQSHMTERILNLTLEIISLLTGERCAVVKMAAIEGLLQGLYPPLSGEQSPITAPPPSPTSQRNMEQKILEVINQVIGLLTRERGNLRCNLIGQEEVDSQVAKLGSSEEHREFHKKTKMDKQMEKIFKTSTMEELQKKSMMEELHNNSIMEELQKKSMMEELHNNSIVEELQKKSMMEELHNNSIAEEHHKKTMTEEQPPLTSLDGSRKKNLPESCPRPFYFCTQENPRIQDHEQIRSENLSSIKVEDLKLDEICVRGDQQTVAEMVVTIKEEDLSPEMSMEQGCDITETSAIGSALSPHCKIEAEDSIGDSSGRPSFNASLHREAGSADPSHPEQCPAGSGAAAGGAGETGDGTFFCYDCSQCFMSSVSFQQHQRVHAEVAHFECSECRKTFKHKSNLVKHQRYHTGERPYPCAQCGKRFIDKSKLTSHLRFHLGMKQYSCSECGESFAYKSHLVVHQRFHTGEKTYSCPQCGNSYIFKSLLKKHLTTHTGEKPHVCSECGKCFLWKSLLERHAKRHRSEKPLHNSGSESFTERAKLNQHSWKTPSM